MGMIGPEGGLQVWVIYREPHDAPGYIVLRAQRVLPTGETLVQLRGYAWAIGDDAEAALERARAYCMQRGLARLARDPSDQPHIVETWI